MSTGFREHPAKLPPIFDPARVARTFADLLDALPHGLEPASRALIEAASGNSPYLARLILKEKDSIRRDGFFGKLLDRGPDDALAALCAEVLSLGREETDETEAMHRMRLAKRRAALTIALADIGGLFHLEQVTGALTRFADACIKGALQFLVRQAAAKAGLSETRAEKLESETGLVVFAMGKMGAFELNYSSDIDLVIFFEEARLPFARLGAKRVAAVDLVKSLLKLVAETTADGYVFRVDLRLRPDAGATQIAISTEAAEDYYESTGQNWERAAWIKARQCAGDREAGARFLKAMVPFVWRKHLDYAAIQDIHSIKRQIHSQIGHGRAAVAGHNIKLGRGGIREIEFFAQTQQLILGGRDPSLRDSRTLGALRALRARGHISAEVEGDLAAAYRFLRLVEHRLQMIDDQQTHTIPKAPDGVDHVARFCGFADTPEFEEVLLGHMRSVQGHYSRLFEGEAPLASRAGSLVFTGVEEDPETVATLTRIGFARPASVSAAIRGWHHGRIRATRSARARELLTKLMPALLEALARTADPDSAFAHWDRLLSGLPAGVQVFSMLIANPRLLDLVAEIAGSAPRLADYLGRNPSVLEALVNAEYLGHIPSPDELRARLADEFARVSGYEAVLDAARRFAKEETFRIGVQVIQGLTDAETVGPAYAAVAETIIAGVHGIVEAEMRSVHGRIAGGAFVVVALGKLGGREMTAASDLDLVFVYTHDPDAGPSDGAKPLAPSTYFARTAQRFIAALTAMTAEGRLYDVDMRLRPSGNQGPVAVRLASFIAYHSEKAWTWERMAQTRARVVSGPPSLVAEVEAAIRAVLTARVDCGAILRDAREMREKLEAQFPGRDPWDIKFAHGGLVDIEFVAQALQLCYAPAEPALLDQNTMVALAKLKAAGHLAAADADCLIAVAHLEHALTQVLRIAVEGAFKPNSSPRGLMTLLKRAGDAPDFAALESKLRASEATVRAIFIRVMAG